MPRVSFTANLARLVSSTAVEVPGSTLREALDGAFAAHPGLRGYLLDDQGGLRKHVVAFIDGDMVRDRVRLSDPVGETSEVHVLQSLSGG